MNALDNTDFGQLLQRRSMSMEGGKPTSKIVLLVNQKTGCIDGVSTSMFSKEGYANIQAKVQGPCEKQKYIVEVADSMSLLAKGAKEELLRLIKEYNLQKA